MSDPRDTNRDGRVSFMEKIKDKLHLHGHKDKDAEYMTYHTTAVGAPTTFVPATTYPNGGYPATGQQFVTGQQFATGQQLVVPGAYAAAPVCTECLQAPGAYDSRNLNRENYIPGGQNFVGATGAQPAAYDSRGSNRRDSDVNRRNSFTTGAQPVTQPAAYDSRDVNRRDSDVNRRDSDMNRRDSDMNRRDSDLSRRDNITAGAQPVAYDYHRDGAGSTGLQAAAYDSRDLNRRDNVVTAAQPDAYDSRDLSRRDNAIAGGQPVAYDSRRDNAIVGAQSAAYDSRDLNRRDNAITAGAQPALNRRDNAITTGAQSSAYDSRDLNRRNGAIATGPQSVGPDSRDLNHDGYVSAREKLAAGLGQDGTREGEMRLRLYEEQLAVSKREVSAGEVGIYKRVQEERVQHSVPVKREELIVERRPLTGAFAPSSATPDEISRVTLYREEILTHTRLVPTEEVIVRRKVVTEHQTVGATLRSEHVETVQMPPTQNVSDVTRAAFDARDANRDTNRDGYISAAENLPPAEQIVDNEGRMTLHEEQLTVFKREVNAGELGIFKRVQEELVQQAVPVKHEELVVERRPLTGGAESSPGIATPDEFTRVTLYREEIIIEKRLVPFEEVIVRKREVIEHQTVDATLRSEHFETMQMGPKDADGAYDVRDTNRDGRVSVGEKLRSAGATSGAYDARDLNHDGHVSMGEKLRSTGADTRDLNHDGHVSVGEKLQSKAARG